ncbi:MAG: tetratricopeptide repeat protein, partial [Treponema sp.]|nr:tetratricopeptide repeat protein [Treponema sp.]
AANSASKPASSSTSKPSTSTAAKTSTTTSTPSKNTASTASSTTDAAAKARQQKLDQARKYIDDGKYAQAITVLNGLLKTDPNDADAKALLKEAQDKKAAADAAAAEKARQDKLNQARNYIDTGKYAQATTILNGLLKTDPNDEEAKSLLKEIEAKKKVAEDAAAKAKSEADAKAAQAKKDADAKAAQAKKDAEAKAAQAKKDAEDKAAKDAADARAKAVAEARSLIDQGKYTQAITLLNSLLKTYPNDTEIKNLLNEAQKKKAAADANSEVDARQKRIDQAKAYIAEKKYANATNILNALLKADPNDKEAQALLDQIKELQKKEEQEAIDEAARARDQKLQQAKEYMEQGKYSLAISTLNGILKNNPDDKEAKDLLAQIQKLQDKAAEEAAAKARQQRLDQARTFIDSKKYTNAINVLNGLLKTNPNDAEAKALLEEAQNKKKIEDEETAAKARQDKLNQAKANIDAGKYSAAITTLNGLLKTNPNDAEAKALLKEAQDKQSAANAEAAEKARKQKLDQAKANIEAGKYSAAISTLNGLLKTDPNDAEAKALLKEAQDKQSAANAEAAEKARKQKLDQAKSNIDSGKYASAISILNGLIKSNPNDAEAKALLKEAEDKKAQEAAEAKKKAEEEAAKKAQAQAEAKKKADEAAAKKAQEAAEKKKQAEEAAAAKKAQEAEAKKKAEEDAAKKKQEAEAKKKAEEEAVKKAQAEADAKKKAEEDAAKKEEAKRKAEEEAEKKAQAAAEAKKKAEEAAAKKAQEDAEAKKKAEEEAARLAAQKAADLDKLQRFTTDWESPMLSDIEDCGYFYTSPEFGQFDMIEGEFSKKSGYTKSAYGFVFGYTKPSPRGQLYNYIRFEINTDGEYALYKWDGKTYTDLVEPNSEGTAYFYKSSAINEGYNATNKLKIQVVNGKYNVYINNHLIKRGIPFIEGGTYGVMGFFSVGQANQEDLPNTPVVVSYRITDAELHRK